MRALDPTAGPFSVHPNPRDGAAELRDARGQRVLELTVDGAEDRKLMTAEASALAARLLTLLIADLTAPREGAPCL